MRINGETKEKRLCVERMAELIMKKAETTRSRSRTRLPLNSKHIVSCYKKESGDVNVRHDMVVNIPMNNIIIERGMISNDQKWDDRKMVMTDTTRPPLGLII